MRLENGVPKNWWGWTAALLLLCPAPVLAQANQEGEWQPTRSPAVVVEKPDLTQCRPTRQAPQLDRTSDVVRQQERLE